MKVSRLSKKYVGEELARRANQFHPNTNPLEIELWGLFLWGQISHLIKSGEIIIKYRQRNKTIWASHLKNFMRNMLNI